MVWRLESTRVVRHSDRLGLRQAEPGDLDAILDIEHAAHPTPWSRDVFEREFDLDWSHVWVAVRGNKTVGFLVFWVVHDEVHILNVAVDPACRRQGIATTIITELITLATEREASFITLEVRQHNQAAIGLYESLGFEIIGQREKYYADTGEDALIMSCLL